MTLPELAKSAVETYIKEEKIISPPENLPKEFLNKRAGVFVTIEKAEKLRGLPRSKPKVLLRGCIGTYLATKENIAQEIIYNAISAATEDYRFGSVKKEELPSLSYTVYILSQPKLVKYIKELNPQKFGIIVKTLPVAHAAAADVVFNGYLPQKSGLLLPALKGVDTAEQQIQICCQKGRINPQEEKIIVSRLLNISDDDAPPTAIIYKFTAEKYQ